MDTSPSPWLDTKATAERLRLKQGTLRTWRTLGKGPPWHKLGRLVRYQRDEVDAWAISS